MTETTPVGDGKVAISEGPETAAAIAAQARVPEIEPLGWVELDAVMAEIGAEAVAASVVEWAEAGLLVHLGDGPDGLDADLWGIFAGAASNEKSAILRYVFERKPSAEALFIKLQEWEFNRGGLFEDLVPAERASLELLVRLVPAVVDVLGVLEAETRRRTPPPEPPAARPIPLDETSLEEMPAFGERMEG